MWLDLSLVMPFDAIIDPCASSMSLKKPDHRLLFKTFTSVPNRAVPKRALSAQRLMHALRKSNSNAPPIPATLKMKWDRNAGGCTATCTYIITDTTAHPLSSRTTKQHQSCLNPRYQSVSSNPGPFSSPRHLHGESSSQRLHSHVSRSVVT
jgi:hypothetical protein